MQLDLAGASKGQGRWPFYKPYELRSRFHRLRNVLPQCGLDMQYVALPRCAQKSTFDLIEQWQLRVFVSIQERFRFRLDRRSFSM